MSTRAWSVIITVAALAAWGSSLGSAGAATPDAYWSCDGQASAALRDGVREAKPENGLRFTEGVKGQALTVGSPDGKNACSVYTPVPDLLGPQGSVSFWVKPLDWHGGDAPFHILLRAMAGDTYFLVYKYFNSNDLLFLIGEFEKWTSVRTPIPDWGPGAWHHIACTWSDSEITLWTDGHRCAVGRLRYPVVFDKLEPLSLGPGGWRDGQSGTSLIDEVRLYRTVIGRADIEQDYLQHADAAGVAHEDDLLTVGPCAPQVDGRAAEDEYGCSTTGFVTTGLALSPRQARAFLGYDQQRLYLAVSGPAAGADRTELYLSPTPAAKPRCRFVFTPDGSAAATRDRAAWPCPGLQTRSVTADGVWTVEAAIPFAALGLAAAPDGQTWRGNVARVYREPAEWTCLAPVVGGPGDWTHFLNLRFRRDAPVLHVTQFVDVAGRTFEPLITARAAAGATVGGALFSSTGRDYGDRTINFTLWQDGKSTPFAPQETPLTGERRLKLAISLKSGGQQPLHQRSFVYDPAAPLSVLAAYTLQESRELRVTARGRGEGTLRVRFLKPDGAMVLERTQPVPANALFFSARFPLDFAVLTPGDYVLRIDHVNAAGAASGTFEQEYRVPDLKGPMFAPYVDPQAAVVPAPWTPLHTGATTAEMWGRSYDLGAGCLVAGLRSQGQELLAAPARLRLDGKELVAASPSQVRRLSSSDMQAEWEKQTDYGVFKLRSHLRVHFDGTCDVTMTLTPPAGQPAQVQSLALEFPFREEVIRLARDAFVSWGSKSGAIGDTWRQTLAAHPLLWVGKEDVGFNWVADDLSQWHFRQADRNVEIVRGGGAAVMRLNLVDCPLRLDQPRTFNFSFVVTPSRPLDPGLRRFRNDKEWQMWCQPWNYFNYLDAAQIEKWRLENASAGHDSTFLYMSHSFISPFCPEWPYWEENWRQVGRAYGECTGDLDAPPVTRNYGCYAEACLGSDSFRNFHLHQLEALLKRAPIAPQARHYYFDFPYGSGCSNRHHGCSLWTDLAGKSRSRLLNARTREVTLATYRMIKRSDPAATLSVHIGFPRDLPVQHFSEVMVIGEGTEPEVATKGSYYDILTPESFRATYLAETWGMKVVFINQLTRALSIFRPEKYAAYNIEDPETRRALLHLLGYLVVHDVDGWWDGLSRYRAIVARLWSTQDALGWDEEVAFHPYWHQDSGVRLASPQSNRVLASAYSRRGKLLLAVLNDTDQPQAVTLQLDLAKLGAKAGLRGSDVWEPAKTYELAPQWQDTIPPRGFRLVLWEG